MAERHSVGGGIGDFVVERGDDDIVRFGGGALLQFWNARDGGSTYDMTTDQAGLTPAPAPYSSDGTDGLEVGDIPLLWLPPDVFFAFVSADGGPRRLIAANDVAALAGQVAVQLAQHVSQVNPHGTTLDTLADTALADPTSRVNGAFIAWDETSQRFVLLAGTGLNPADFVKTAGGSTIRIPDNNTTTVAQSIRIPAGDRSAAPDTLKVELNTGTNGSPVWTEVLWLDPYGQLRAQATADNRIALKVLRKSSGATADIAQFCDQSGTPLAWVSANGSLRAPNVGRSQVWTKSGTVTAGQGKFRYTNISGVPQLLRALIFDLDVTPATGTMVFDVLLNGTTLYPSGKPQIASGATTTGIITAAFTIPAGGKVRIDIGGTFTGGSDLAGQADFV